MNDERGPNQPPDPIDLEVGVRLRSARQAQGQSQEDLGKRLKLTAHEVQRLEKGLDRLSAVMVVRAAEALGVSPAALLPEPLMTSCSACEGGETDSPELPDETRLLSAFHRLGSKALKASVVDFALQLAEEGEADGFATLENGDPEPNRPC